MRAVEEGRYRDAYALCGRPVQARWTYQEFEEALRADPDALRPALRELRAAAADLREEAEIDLGDQGRLRLVREGRAWRIAGNPLDFYPQDTPRRALRSFLRAADRRRYDVLWRLAPERWRARMTPDRIREQWEGPMADEIDAMLAELRAHAADPIHEEDDEARMPYGEGRQARFAREDGVWKIADPD